MDKNIIVGTNTNAGAGLIAGEDYGRKVVALTAEIKTQEGGRPYRIKENGDIEIVERLCPQPVYRRGTTHFYEALSFARYVKRFRNLSSILFADALASGGPRFTAVLDYHPEGGAQASATWDLFRAVLPLRKTPSWMTWETAHGKLMEQAEFALFLEDNIPDIYDPVGALLVEIARTLEANVDVSFQSHIRADNGAHRFAFVETINGTATTAKDGRIEIPQEFILVLQPFEGAKQYQVKARLRYRLAQGKVRLGFELVRLQDVLKEAFDDELLKIEGELNGVGRDADDEIDPKATVTPVFNGPAPEPVQPTNLAKD